MGTADLAAMLAQRRALGQDRFDEVWGGEYRMVPGPRIAHARLDAALLAALGPYARAAGLTALTTFNLGTAQDYRVPDQGYLRHPEDTMYVPTAEIVVEVLSPGDQTFAKFGFYAAHGVHEIVVADPDTAAVQIHTLVEGPTSGEPAGYTRTDRSELLDLTAAALVAVVDWP